MKLTKSQIASMVAGAATFVVANWSTIGPYITDVKNSLWMQQHPGVKLIVTGIGILVPMLARSILKSKSGIPGQDPTIQDAPAATQ